MNPSATRTVDRSAASERLLDRIVVGVDGSAASLEAARQAARLTREGTRLTILSACDVPPPAVIALDEWADDRIYREAADAALATVTPALHMLATAETVVSSGVAWDTLLLEAEREHATLLVVGSHGRSRLGGIVLGSTSTEIVHKAPCSVLVARPARHDPFGRVVVGVDGSRGSARAFRAASVLAARVGSDLWCIVAHGGGEVDRREIERIAGHRYEDSPDDPVRALRAASAEADLVVVGSRGLHGLRALGSVSERIAHRALCSTLVVRAVEEGAS
jgi:nucleotide-binding universal stress UspA family protein